MNMKEFLKLDDENYLDLRSAYLVQFLPLKRKVKEGDKEVEKEEPGVVVFYAIENRKPDGLPTISFSSTHPQHVERIKKHMDNWSTIE
jgi:hypothetical protein